jgi:hypothetical protein
MKRCFDKKVLEKVEINVFEILIKLFNCCIKKSVKYNKIKEF